MRHVAVGLALVFGATIWTDLVPPNSADWACTRALLAITGMVTIGVGWANSMYGGER